MGSALNKTPGASHDHDHAPAWCLQGPRSSPSSCPGRGQLVWPQSCSEQCSSAWGSGRDLLLQFQDLVVSLGDLLIQRHVLLKELDVVLAETVEGPASGTWLQPQGCWYCPESWSGLSSWCLGQIWLGCPNTWWLGEILIVWCPVPRCAQLRCEGLGVYLRLGVGSVGAGVGYVTMEEGNVFKLKGKWRLHGIRKGYCRECGGSYTCEHNCVKCYCKDCRALKLAIWFLDATGRMCSTTERQAAQD